MTVAISVSIGVPDVTMQAIRLDMRDMNNVTMDLTTGIVVRYYFIL